MIGFLPRLYEEEILYSYIARYHYYSTVKNFKETITEVFGYDSVIPVLDFPAHLGHANSILFKNLGLSIDRTIDNLTLLPYFAPFLLKEIGCDIRERMINRDGRGIKTKLGLVAGNIGSQEELLYCPKCAEYEYSNYKDPYFHRVHQLPGVYVCPQHECYLKTYPISRSENSRIGFIKFDYDKIELTFKDEKDIALQQRLLQISKGSEYILRNNLSQYDINKVQNIYMALLMEKGYLTVKGFIHQNELCENINSFYGERLLKMLDSQVDVLNEYNWVKVLTRKQSRIVHPLRHILFMIFLCGNVESFFEKPIINDNSKQLYPCLNPVAGHYRELIISNPIITADYKTREPVATFPCECGFTYSRKMKDDMYKVGRVKEFGHLWEDKLRAIISNEAGSLRSIARKMKADVGTIKKYIEKLRLTSIQDKIESVSCINIIDAPSQHEIERKDVYIERLRLYVSNTKGHPSRTQIRAACKKEYMWLYRHDKNLLESLLPNKQSSRGPEIRVDWQQRDKDIYNGAEKQIKQIIENQEKIRITIGLLGKRLGMLSMLEKNLDKLPKTKSLLKEKLESVEDFQIRRIKYIVLQAKKNNIIIPEWRIYREAGIRKECSERVKKIISENVRASE